MHKTQQKKNKQRKQKTQKILCQIDQIHIHYKHFGLECKEIESKIVP
jgi:hypothetical protein